MKFRLDTSDWELFIAAYEVQWTLESRTHSVPRGGSTFSLFGFRVKFRHKKLCKLN
jgi:hypothetical protein